MTCHTTYEAVPYVWCCVAVLPMARMQALWYVTSVYTLWRTETGFWTGSAPRHRPVRNVRGVAAAATSASASVTGCVAIAS